MRPTLTTRRTIDTMPRNAIPIREFCVNPIRSAVFVDNRSDLENVGFGENVIGAGIPLRVSLRPSAFSMHVSHVVKRCSDEKMLGIKAVLNVAVVTDKQRRRQVKSEPYMRGEAMNRDTPAFNANLPIAVCSARSRPEPASRRVINLSLAQEAFFGLLKHLVLPSTVACRSIRGAPGGVEIRRRVLSAPGALLGAVA